MYDAIVIGARCAGSPTAMLLARKGHRVLVLDRDRFPSDIFRAHYVRWPAAQALRRWGLLDRVLATGCPPVTSYTMDFDDFPLTGAPALPDEIPPELAPRRKVLDAILVEAAVEAGAELREGVVVDDLLWDDGRVVGVRGRSRGTDFEERAGLVIGADGQHSLVAQKVGAAVRESTPPLTFGYYTYWADVPMPGLQVTYRLAAGRVFIAFPTNDSLCCIAVQGRSGDFSAFRTDVEGEYLRAIDLVDDLAARTRAGRRAERFQGTADLPNFVRAATGPGWVLVGDAGHHRDPILANGITDAFRDAELLAEAVDRGLTGAAPLDDALAEYERQRDEGARPGHDATIEACSLRPFPPELLQLRAAVRGDPATSGRLFAMQMGLLPPEQVLGPVGG